MRSGSPQRVDRYEGAQGQLAEQLHRFGYRAAVAAPVSVEGRLWGALAAATRSDARLPDDLETRLCDFADLVAQRLANADAHEQLAASRARIVEAGDAERRRLERNLHDGAQQRLVSVAVDLRLAGVLIEKDPAGARKVLDGAQEQLAKGLEELRELARGIHPAVLTDRGLGPALEGLLARAPVPVEITELPEERLSGPVEAAAYYVVAEAITNVAKYAQASNATVSIRRSNGPRDRGRRRQRRRRSGPRPRLGPPRARGPPRGARRPAPGGEHSGARNPDQRRDPGLAGSAQRGRQTWMMSRIEMMPVTWPSSMTTR